jgi:hypothetical protein
MLYVYGNDVQLDDVREIKWKVGRYQKDIVTKGIRVRFELPLLKDEGMEKLYKKGIDSFVIRMKRRTLGRVETMGYYSLEFASPHPRSPKEIRFKRNKVGSLGVNFAAGSISERLNRLSCPAFNHRLRLKTFEVKRDREFGQLWSIGSMENRRISAKVTPIAYTPIVINGGMGLTGEYFVEVAFYSQKTHEKRSNFVRLYDSANVGKSEAVYIKGCSNAAAPNRGSEDPVDKFKFSR